ncbi:exopolysaccharide biosynthesis operon protein EpsL [Duganella sp. CF402]|nr:exopolysaccharide biosynthesis operon protein EpsL [Duganella sp. BK701]SEM31286.1 exopolysaccharide biosynthesis operon protein EpsL [Duganella sp. CF402]
MAGPRARQAILLGGLLCSLSAHAALSDTIHPFVGGNYSYDSNLFRVDDNGRDTVESDRIRQTFAGVEVERTFGRQRFSGSARVSRVSFDRFSMLDYTGKDANGTLYWQLGNHLDGTLGGTYSSTLTSFTDYQGTERNLRVQRSEFVDGGWRFHPSWRVRARLSNDKYEFDAPSQRYLNRKDKASEVGLDYLGVTGSTIGLQVRRVTGDYLTPQTFGPFVFDPSYTQDEVKLKVFWKFSEQHQLQFLGGRVRRGHESQTLRDSNGTNGRVTDTWNVTPAVSLVSALWREYTPFEGSTASYALNKGASIDGKWALSAKIQATGQLRYVERDFAGFVNPVAVAPEDKSHVVSLGLNYSPRQNLVLSASVNRDQRKSDTTFSRSYKSNGASFSASIEF